MSSRETVIPTTVCLPSSFQLIDDVVNQIYTLRKTDKNKQVAVSMQFTVVECARPKMLDNGSRCSLPGSLRSVSFYR